MIELTDIAAKKIKSNLERRGHGIGIRIGIRTTGCSGLAYVLEYVDQIKEDCGDSAITVDGINIIVNQRDEPYFAGMTIDYVRQGLNEGFEFVNPNEKDRCGCGESFRV